MNLFIMFNQFISFKTYFGGFVLQPSLLSDRHGLNDWNDLNDWNIFGGSNG